MTRPRPPDVIGDALFWQYERHRGVIVSWRCN